MISFQQQRWSDFSSMATRTEPQKRLDQCFTIAMDLLHSTSRQMNMKILCFILWFPSKFLLTMKTLCLPSPMDLHFLEIDPNNWCELSLGTNCMSFLSPILLFILNPTAFRGYYRVSGSRTTETGVNPRNVSGCIMCPTTAPRGWKDAHPRPLIG